MRKLIALVGLIACASVEAANWLKIDGSKDRTTWLDVNSIARASSDDDLWTVWMKQEYKRPKLNTAGRKYVEVLDQDLVRCSARSMANLQYIQHGDDGSVTDSYSTSLSAAESSLDAVAPDTIGEAIVDIICKK